MMPEAPSVWPMRPLRAVMAGSECVRELACREEVLDGGGFHGVVVGGARAVGEDDVDVVQARDGRRRGQIRWRG